VDEKVNTTGDDVRRAWEEHVRPHVEDIRRARLGLLDTPGAVAHHQLMELRTREPEVWTAWGKETARRYCLHDSLNVPEAVNLDHRHQLLMYPESEFREVAAVMQRACMEELIRLWPAVARMRIAAADGQTTGSYNAEIDLSGDLEVFIFVGRRIAAYREKNQYPFFECDGRFLRVRICMPA
jgi:hypothetical protein